MARNKERATKFINYEWSLAILMRNPGFLLYIFLIYLDLFPQGLSLLRQKKTLFPPVPHLYRIKACTTV